MTPDDLDRILDEAARSLPGGEERGSAGRVTGAILRDLRPVRPLAPAWIFTLAFLVVFAIFAASSASALGMRGLYVLSAIQRLAIFPALSAAAWLAAMACSREMTPAGGSRLGGLALIIAVTGFAIVFSLIFKDYTSRNLVKEGIPCLVAGLCVAIPTGLAVAWIVRRGFVLDGSAAGLAAGALSGLAGLAMLELHCPNLKAIHVMLWHVVVVFCSGILGFAAGRFTSALSSRGR